MTTVNVHAAKTHFSRLLDDVAAGAEVVIAKAGRPVARLVAIDSAAPAPRRRLGALAGLAVIPPAFDASLPDAVLDAFEDG